MKISLIGWPLGHSLSPVFQNAGLRACGISGEYSLLPVEPEKDLGEVLSALRADPEWAGSNVTVPFKEKVIPFLDKLEGAAEALRAVNTIVRKGDGLIGYNTDMPGFLADLQRHRMKPEGGSVMVIGSGGAARAVVLGLVECGCDISLIAVLHGQAESLARDLGSGRVHIHSWEDAVVRDLAENAGLVVNASPVGMWPDVDASPWPSHLPLPKRAAVYDLVYNPLDTRLLSQAKGHGLVCASGLGMLVEQGALAFELWTGREAPVGLMRTAAWDAIRSGEK